MLKLGSFINRNGWCGRIVAVSWVGERYYWLKGKDNTISMVPAMDLETKHPTVQ